GFDHALERHASDTRTVVQRELHNGTLSAPARLPQYVILSGLVLLVPQQKLDQAVESRVEPNPHGCLAVVRRHRQRFALRNPLLQLEQAPLATEAQQLLSLLIARRLRTGRTRLCWLPHRRRQHGRWRLSRASGCLLVPNAL